MPRNLTPRSRALLAGEYRGEHCGRVRAPCHPVGLLLLAVESRCRGWFGLALQKAQPQRIAAAAIAHPFFSPHAPAQVQSAVLIASCPWTMSNVAGVLMTLLRSLFAIIFFLLAAGVRGRILEMARDSQSACLLLQFAVLAGAKMAYPALCVLTDGGGCFAADGVRTFSPHGRVGTLPLRLRGGGFAAVVPDISRMLGTTKDPKVKRGKKQPHGAKLSANDAALLDALKTIESDAQCAERVAALLAAGACVTAQDAESLSAYAALHLAASQGLTATACVLVEGGAKVDAPARHGQTPLALAAARGHNCTVARLLSLGAQPSLPDMLGWTPLHQAAHYGNPGIVECLLAAGADPNAETKDGATAQALAQKNPLIPTANAIAITDAIAVAALKSLGGSNGGVGRSGVPVEEIQVDMSRDYSNEPHAKSLGDDSKVMQTALSKGQRVSDATTSALLEIRSRYQLASREASPLLSSAVDQTRGAGEVREGNSRSICVDDGEDELEAIVQQSAGAGGTEQEQVQRALMLMQQRRRAPTSDVAADNGWKTSGGNVGTGGGARAGGDLGDCGYAGGILERMGRLSGWYQVIQAHQAGSSGELSVQIGEDVRVVPSEGAESLAWETRGFVSVEKRGGGRGCIPERCLVDQLPLGEKAASRSAGSGTSSFRDEGANDGGAREREVKVGPWGLTGGGASLAANEKRKTWSLLDVGKREPAEVEVGGDLGSRGEAGGGRASSQMNFRERAKMTMAMDLRPLDLDMQMAGGAEVDGAETVCGIGVSITADTAGHYVVRSVREDGPAAMLVGEQIRPGDLLLAVDGHSVAGVSPEGLQDMVLGPAQSQVQLTFATPTTPGNASQFSVTLKRAALPPDASLHRLAPDAKPSLAREDEEGRG